MCLCTNVYTKGTVYTSVKAKAVTGRQESGQQLGLNNNAVSLYTVVEFLE